MKKRVMKIDTLRLAFSVRCGKHEMDNIQPQHADIYLLEDGLIEIHPKGMGSDRPPVWTSIYNARSWTGDPIGIDQEIDAEYERNINTLPDRLPGESPFDFEAEEVVAEQPKEKKLRVRPR